VARSLSLKLAEPTDALYRIKRGLSAYVSYLAACDMNQAFSEYVLYEPILRILTAKGYVVSCEVEAPGVQQPARGDKKRIDFVAVGHGIEVAIEVKWAKDTKISIARDIEKLVAFKQEKPKAFSLLCVFGRQSHLEKLELPPRTFKERGQAVYADLRKTKFGCRVFALLPAKEREAK
jgi:Holliday junction resolvase